MEGKRPSPGDAAPGRGAGKPAAEKRARKAPPTLPDPSIVPPGYDEAVIGVPFADVASACRVMAVLAGRLDVFDSKPLKILRQFMAPLAEYQAGKMYDGMDRGSFDAMKEAKSQERRRQARDVALDKVIINKRQLRSSRLAKLRELTADGAIDVPLIPDGVVDTEPTGPSASLMDAPSADSGSSVPAVGTDGATLTGTRSCYVCKARFRVLHHFYDQLCPPCAELNFSKRHQVADLTGYVAIVTGGRVKIGYRCVLKLLRCGAVVIATTRFPHESTERFTSEKDFPAWSDRLHIVGLDLRDSASIEHFVDFVAERFPRVDILVNNACQTVRRPPSFYAHMLDTERLPVSALPAPAAAILRSNVEFRAALTSVYSLCGPSAAPALEDGAAGSAVEDVTPALASQVPFVPGDEAKSTALFPVGLKDVNDQQVDLRTTNSWKLKLGEISTPEAAEVFAINALGPFILNSKLKPLMASTPSSPIARHAFIVNVSAMEGKFYRFKAPTHPHTNMAKAALNMMTRTSAPDYATALIFMTSVDTGWINDENPLEVASRIATQNNFQTPLDEEDAAARVLDPIIHSVATVAAGDAAFVPPHGVFLKDYKETEW